MNDEQHFVTYSSGLQFGYFPLLFECNTLSASPSNTGYGFAFYDSGTCEFLYLDEAVSVTPASQDTSLVLCDLDYSGSYEFSDGRKLTLCLDSCDQCSCSDTTCSFYDNENDCSTSCAGNCEWNDGIEGLEGYEDGYCGDRCPEPVDLVFVIDESGSVRNNFVDERNFAVDIIATSTSADSNFGVIYFDNEIIVQHTLDDANQDPSYVAQIVQGYYPSHFGGTTISQGVDAAISMFNTHDSSTTSGGSDRDNVMVLITDGNGGNPCNGGTLETTTINNLQANNIATVAVGINGVSAAQLNCLNEDPLDGVSVGLDNFQDLLYEIRKYTNPYTCPSS